MKTLSRSLILKKMVNRTSGSIMAAIILAACGSALNGSYTMTQMGGAQMCGTSSQINLNLQQNGNTVSGSASNGCFTETLTGTNSNNQVSNVTLTITATGSQNMGYQSGYGSSTQCIYIGSLAISGNQISGTLTIQNQQMTMTGMCTATVQITGTKLN